MSGSVGARGSKRGWKKVLLADEADRPSRGLLDDLHVARLSERDR
jgi:hypothetical protein